MEDHPDRERLQAEMHLRRLPPLGSPTTLVQYLYTVPPDRRPHERSTMLAMPAVHPADVHDHPRHAEGIAPDGAHFLWERLTEASMATVVVPSDGRGADAIDRRTAEWLAGNPGLVLRAVRVHIVESEAEALDLLDTRALAQPDFVSCRIGPARLWSTFQPGADGIETLVLSRGTMPPADMGRLVQKIQELGNYRTLALLGLPMVQAHMALLNVLEQTLAEVTSRINTRDEEAELLTRLSTLAARTAAIEAGTAYRLSATAAYAQIAGERLASIASVEIEGYQSLAHFTDRRLLPAVRTCSSFGERLERLSARSEQAASLLRTRVELAIQKQNGALLASVDRNAATQVRLQRLVEGVSVIAISYYALGIIDHLLTPVAHAAGFDSDTLLALLVVPLLVSAYVLLRRRTENLLTNGDRERAGD